jgi:hypothetical protein
MPPKMIRLWIPPIKRILSSSAEHGNTLPIRPATFGAGCKTVSINDLAALTGAARVTRAQSWKFPPARIGLTPVNPRSLPGRIGGNGPSPNVRESLLTR